MSDKRRCIFHIPNHLDEPAKSASQIRPRKMLQAFRDIGYEVDAVMGYGAQRKEAIARIEQNIRSGVRYDFLYSESSTMPTLLTEKNHMPTYPNLDFGFFSFCKKHGIKIGLFYRDLYWKFPAYHNSVRGLRYLGAMAMYKYDLRRYSQLLDKFYCPSPSVRHYIDEPRLQERFDTLCPGADFFSEYVAEKERYFQSYSAQQGINIFYVGGVGSHYRFDNLLQAIGGLDFVRLTICCREKEWEAVRPELQPYMTDRIRVVHASGEGLLTYYHSATLCLALFEPVVYRKLAMPVKCFEYLSHVTPMLVTAGTEMGDFVKENGIGWDVDYDVESIRSLLVRLHEAPEEIIAAHQKSILALADNTWAKRAEKVARQLTDQ